MRAAGRAHAPFIWGPDPGAVRPNRHHAAVALAILALAGGLATQLSQATLVEDGGVVVIVAALVTLAVEVPRVILGANPGRRTRRS
jgi:hypothetical protein